MFQEIEVMTGLILAIAVFASMTPLAWGFLEVVKAVDKLISPS